MRKNDCRRLRRTIMSLWLIAMLFAVINAPAEVAAWTTPWSEDFGTTDYLDSEATTATGWGADEVGIPYKHATFLNNCSSSFHTLIRPGVFDDYIYPAVYNEGFDVIDISAPANPAYVTFIESPEPRFMASRGGYGYLCDYNDGLRILNLTDMESPIEVATYNPGPVVHITLDGDFGYLSTDGEGIHVLNISNPLEPISACNYTQVNATSVYQTQKEGNYLFAVEYNTPIGDYGLQIINATDPTDITYMSRLVTPAIDYDLIVSGNTIYLCGYHSYLYVISVETSLFSPELVATINVPNVGYPGTCALSNGYFYVGHYSLTMFSATDTDNPRVDRIPFDQNAPNCHWIVVIGDYVYTDGGDFGSTWVGAYELDDALAAKAQSLPFYPPYQGLIAEATLTVDTDTPSSTSISFDLSADNGTHWEQVTPGTSHVFTTNGRGLAWRADLSTTTATITPRIHSVSLSIKVLLIPPEILSISYQEGYNDPIFFFDLDDSPVLFQLDTVQTFDSPNLINKTAVQFSGAISGYGVKLTGWNNGTLISYLENGTYYYRFARIDPTDDIGFWSEVETLQIGTTATTLLPPDMILILVIGGAVGVVIIVVVVVKLRKKG